MFLGILLGCMRLYESSMQFLIVYLGWCGQNKQFLVILGCFFGDKLRWQQFGPNEPHYMLEDFMTDVLKKKIHWCMFFFSLRYFARSLLTVFAIKHLENFRENVRILLTLLAPMTKKITVWKWLCMKIPYFFLVRRNSLLDISCWYIGYKRTEYCEIYYGTKCDQSVTPNSEVLTEFWRSWRLMIFHG